MNDLANIEKQLPDTLEDLSRFALVGREKLTAVRAEIRAIKKVGLAKEVLEQKKAEAQEIAELVTLSEVKIGGMLNDVPKASGGDRKSENFKNRTVADFEKPKSEVLKDIGLKPDTAERYQKMAQHEDIVREAIAEARENDDVVSRSAILGKIKKKEKSDQIEKARQHIADQNKPLEKEKPEIIIANSLEYLPEGEFDLLLTDPPYSTDVEDIYSFVEKWLHRALRKIKPTGFAYVFIGAYPEEIEAYFSAPKPSHMELVQPLIWTYKNTLGNNPKDRYKLNYQMCLFFRGKEAPCLDCPLTNEQWAVQEINAPDGRQGDRYHAWQKPMEIAERFIRHSTKQGQTVLDPFACTGTFSLAATKLGRKAIGIEIDPENAKIAEERGCLIKTL